MCDPHRNALARLHGLPCRVVRGKFATCNNHLITGRPLKRVGDSRETRSRSGRQRDVIRAGAYQGRQRLAQTPSNGKKGLVVDDVWPALRSEEHTSELQSLTNLVCRLLLEKKK